MMDPMLLNFFLIDATDKTRQLICPDNQRANVIKLFTGVINKFLLYARVFVRGKAFQPSLMFEEARSLTRVKQPKSFTHKHQKGGKICQGQVLWLITKMLNITMKSFIRLTRGQKGYETLAPGVNVIKFLLLTMRPNKLECLYLAISIQSSLTFAGNTGSLPKKEASERPFNCVCSGLALKFQDLTGKGFPRTNPLAYQAWSSVTKEKGYITLAPVCRSP